MVNIKSVVNSFLLKFISLENVLSGFTEENNTELQNLGIVVREFSHAPTTARHFHLEAEDDNNAFMVGFPTIPDDSTGVAHILEHTALCGSKRYPVRDPFFMMLRRSLNTYMNAFTAPDMTAYPFATKNKKDFYNLLEVYLDATFFPLLDELDFLQEGWRYELKDSGAVPQILYQGVVFNEMKGAMSSPNSQLWQYLHSSLFPDTNYRFNSGGDPIEIPNLTYAQLKSFHQKHYSPANAVFLTYGDLPYEKHQEKFENLVLNEFNSAKEVAKIKFQASFDEPSQIDHFYYQSSLDGSSDFVLWAWVYGSVTDPIDVVEMNLVTDILIGHSGSPLQAYLESIKESKSPSELNGVDDSSRQLIFACGLEGVSANEKKIDTYENRIFEILRSLIENPPSRETLTATLDRLELDQSDLGAGNYPLGLQLFGRILPSTIYRDDPLNLFRLENIIGSLRSRLSDENFFPNLIKKIFLNNKHWTRITMRASMDVNPERLIKEKLQSVTSSFSKLEKDKIKSESNLLEKRQNTKCNDNILPRLTLKDVPAGALLMEPSDLSEENIKAFDVLSNNIFRIKLAFPISNLNDQELKLLPIWCEFITQLGSETDGYRLVQQKRAAVGEFEVNCHFSSRADEGSNISGFITVSAKGLNRKIDEIVTVAATLIQTARYDENERLVDLLMQASNEYEHSVVQRGHYLAMLSSARHLNQSSGLEEMWSGCSFINDLKKIVYDDQKKMECDAVFEIFRSIKNKVLQSEPLIMSATDRQNLRNSVTTIKSFYRSLPSISSEILINEKSFEEPMSWVIESNVNFCAASYKAVLESDPDAAVYSVLGKYLQDEYLHSKIREKGGAYGSGASYSPSGESFKFFSYRDPRLSGTIQDFRESIKHFLGSKCNSKRLEESILGVIRNLDGSRRPVAEASRSFNCILNCKTDDSLKEFRENVLHTDFNRLKRVAENLVGQKPNISIISNKAHIEELRKNKFSFDKI